MARVLLADDDVDFQTVLRISLAGAGYEVETVPDGKQAIQAHQQRPADILITDLFMPEQDGLETVVFFRKHNPDMPIIAISGSKKGHTTDHLYVARHAGANVILRKPFEIGKLLEQVQKLTSGK